MPPAKSPPRGGRGVPRRAPAPPIGLGSDFARGTIMGGGSGGAGGGVSGGAARPAERHIRRSRPACGGASVSRRAVSRPAAVSAKPASPHARAFPRPESWLTHKEDSHLGAGGAEDPGKCLVDGRRRAGIPRRNGSTGLVEGDREGSAPHGEVRESAETVRGRADTLAAFGRQVAIIPQILAGRSLERQR